ncbi:MAG: hypothetical protein KDG89_10275 [Geminicoccaceae bacterium]|nr:hypothetical protein [Geminicoccaceae bacterium]
MPTLRPPLPLRGLLLVDALTCAVMGLLLAVAAGPIAALTAIPSALLFEAGLALFPIAAFIAWVATRAPIRSAGAWTVIAGNALWVAGSVLLLVAGWIAPNGLGVAFIALQALAVAALALLERHALGGTRAPSVAGVGAAP